MRFVKFIFWLFISVILLFILLIGIIQLPFVQNKIIHTATNFISKKTQTKVEIDHITVIFPNKVILNKIYFEDKHKDTLLYAGRLAINITTAKLLSNTVHIHSLNLSDVNLNVSRAENDSIYNFNFLLTAFSEPNNSKPEAPDKSSTGWTFILDNLKFRNINLSLKDSYDGIMANLNLAKLHLKMNSIDINKTYFDIDNLDVDKLIASINITKTTEPETQQNSTLPWLKADNIKIQNSKLIYKNNPDTTLLSAFIKDFQMNSLNADLQKQIISLDKILLHNSNIKYDFYSINSDTNITEPANNESNWKVNVKKIDLSDNSIAYNAINKTPLKNSFNPENINFTNLNLKTNNLTYSTANTALSISDFTLKDKFNNFSLNEFKADFKMDNKNLLLSNMQIKTNSSEISTNAKFLYTSLKSLKDSLPFVKLNVDLQKSQIANSDILYFIPAMNKISFFKNRTLLTSLSAKLNGQINDVKVSSLIIKTANNTTLNSKSISIKGLPDFKTAHIITDNLLLKSSGRDIRMLTDTLIPESLQLPEQINLTADFNGQLLAFKSNLAINTSIGNANIIASIDKNENFHSNINVNKFNLGKLLRDEKMYGPVSLTTEIKGKGLDKKNITATINSNISELFLNNYNYNNLSIKGNITAESFKGTINLNDKNIELLLDGYLSLIPEKEQYDFKLDLKGANLQKLNLANNDIRVALKADVNLKGGKMELINGDIRVLNIIISQDAKKYFLDSLIIASINEPDRSQLNISSAIIGIKYDGNFAPSKISDELISMLNQYFPLSENNKPIKKPAIPSKFNLEIQIHNHPVLREVFVRDLKEFEPVVIKAAFDPQKNNLEINTEINKINYANTILREIVFSVNSDNNELNYSFKSRNLSNAQIKLENFTIAGKIKDKNVFTEISSIDDNETKKLVLNTQLKKENNNFRIFIEPDNFFLANAKYTVADDNFIEIAKKGIFINNLLLSKNNTKIFVSSTQPQNLYDSDISISIKNFNLAELSGIIEKDTAIAEGNLNAEVLLKKNNDTYTLVSDGSIDNFFFREIPIGNLSFHSSHSSPSQLNMDISLNGVGNILNIKGYIINQPAANNGQRSTDNGQRISINADIQQLSMKTIEAFSLGALLESNGFINGQMAMSGNFEKPEITGNLNFNNVSLTPAFLNNPLYINNQTIDIKKDGFYFNSFTLKDKNQNTANINGSIKMQQFKNIVFALGINSNNFLLFNTVAEDNELYYGKLIIDSRINISGPMELPVVDANIKIKKGSHFTFAVPEQKQSTDKGEGVVEFKDSLKLNRILYENQNSENTATTAIKGFEINSTLEVDKSAILRLMIDPSSNDSLVVRGEAALSFAIDRSGKMSITGSYNLVEGSYLVTLEALLKRNFDILPGSYINWFGDVYDANVSIDAVHTVRTSPIDLVADQIAGLNETEQISYKQRFPFIVKLKLRGEILHPLISFEILLPPENKGILGGAINAKLNTLNENPSELNKQVFALLVLGRFIQENPLQTEGASGTSTAIRSTVGKVLSQQLNQWSARNISGVELNFDIQSYEDYQTGNPEGRTQVDVGLKKQLFNERLSVQVGGNFDVEGSRAARNNTNNITSDIAIEYKLSEDGRYRIKSFRKNQYEDPIDAQLIETGVGFLYVREFNKWRELFKPPQNKKETLDETNNK